MKTATIVFIGISLLLALFIGFCIVNTYISLKYEIDEVRWLGKTVSINVAESYLKLVLENLYYFLAYVLANTAFLIILLFKEKNSNKR